MSVKDYWINEIEKQYYSAQLKIRFDNNLLIETVILG